MSTRTQDKEAVIPQETDPDLPVNVQKPPVDVWADSGLPWGQRHEYTSPGSHGMLASVLLKVTITPTIVWPQAELQGGNTAPPISRKLDLRFTEHSLAHQRKTQFFPQQVPPNKKHSTSLLSSSIRGQTELKPQSQKTKPHG